MGLMGTAQSNSYIPNSSAVHARDAIKNKNVVAPTTAQKEVGLNGYSPYKHYRKMNRNQRQYRKWLKQVPQFRNSKKCRL